MRPLSGLIIDIFFIQLVREFREESEKSLGEVRDFKKIYECGNHVSLRDSSWSKQLASLPS